MRQLDSKKNALSHQEQLAIASQTAGAMECVHALRIVHRDVSARNVLVAAISPIVVKLADFGCTCLLDLGVYFITYAFHSGAAAGSKQYILPSKG
jgi:serine/threonine protein kinase